MYPHRIRLLGPWDCERIGAPQLAGSKPQHIAPPICFRDKGLRGTLRLTRRFGYPGRIDSYEHVWLTFAEVADQAAATLNDQPLGTGLAGTFEMEVTPLLAARNRLEIVLNAESEGAGLGEVALEVRRDAFLRGLRAIEEPGGTLRVTGSVVGTGGPLELYALAGGRTAYYCPTEAAPEGKPFDLAILPESPTREIRVELVCGAEQWYVVDVTVE